MGRPGRRLGRAGGLGCLALGKRLALALLELPILVVGALGHHEGGVLVVDAALGKVAALDERARGGKRRFGAHLHARGNVVEGDGLALAHGPLERLQLGGTPQVADAEAEQRGETGRHNAERRRHAEAGDTNGKRIEGRDERGNSDEDRSRAA